MSYDPDIEELKDTVSYYSGLITGIKTAQALLMIKAAEFFKNDKDKEAELLRRQAKDLDREITKTGKIIEDIKENIKEELGGKINE